MLGKTIAAALLLTATTAQADFAKQAMPFTASLSTAAATGQDRLFNRPNYETAAAWMTTSDGCSYSRAQAPGYAPTWHLILNPHHIGQPPAHSGCKAMLQG